MKAVVFHRYGDIDVLQIEDMPKPKIAADEVLVQVKSSAINPKDTFIRKGRFKRFTGNKFPQQTGFDFSGIVTESNLADFTVGEAVFGMLDGWHGATCAEYVAVKTNQLAPMPDNISFDEGASVPLVALTALQALRDDTNIKAGDRVCINGASGGVGTMAVQIAKIFGADVTAIASQKNHEFLLELGADTCIDYHDIDIRQSDSQFDIFFDVFGNTRFREIKPILSKHGTWISTVLQGHVFRSILLSRLGRKSAKIVVVKVINKDLLTISRWMLDHKLRTVIAHMYPLDAIQEAHLQQQSKHSGGKIVVQIDS